MLFTKTHHKGAQKRKHSYYTLSKGTYYPQFTIFHLYGTSVALQD